MKLINTFLLLLCLATATSFAQDYKYETSEAIDVSLAGWNKVLLMPNGNTLFFHFENRKGIIVKVFDKEHKEIASLKHATQILDINQLDRSFLDAIVEIKGEAVLFITQQVNNKETTIRINIDAASGKILTEEKLIQSQSFQKKTITHFLKENNTDNYYFVCREKKAGFDEISVVIKKYNGSHELIKEIPVQLDQKGFDKVILQKSLISNENDIIIFIEMSKIIQYPDRMEYTNIMGYLPKNGEKLLYKKFDISVLPSQFTHNTFAHTLNLFFNPSTYQKEHDDLRHTMLILNDDFSEATISSIHNQKINDVIATKFDTGKVFNASTSNMTINKYGLTTIIYYGGTLPKEKNASSRSIPNISFVQLDDKGKEIEGGLFPIIGSKWYSSTEPYIFMFKKSAEEVNNIVSLNYKGEFYIIDNSKITDIPNTNIDTTICKSTETNAVMYKINRKKEFLKSYLLGKPLEAEYKQIYAGSGNFNETTGEYVAVYLHRQGKNVETKIAWVHFEP